MTYYDRIAAGYIELHQEEQKKKLVLIKKHLAVQLSDVMLDIGCGPYFGDFPCRVIGIDSSIALLRKAQIPVIHAQAEALPFRDHCFDVVVSITALQNFNDINKALMEAQRVGKERFAFTFLKRSLKAQSIEILIHKHFQVVRRIEEDKDIIFIAKYKKG
jgi:ubiquinone/menaquinone biosynthesis C-methylase UbiE